MQVIEKLFIHNNFIITDFIDNRTDYVEYEHIHITILFVSVYNTSLVISEGNFGSIDAEDMSCNGYYTIKFSSYPYILQEISTVYGRVINYG